MFSGPTNVGATSAPSLIDGGRFAAPYHRLLAVADNSVEDEALRGACQQRVRVLLGEEPGATPDVTAVPLPLLDLVLEYTEVFVMDAHAVEDALVARVVDALGEAQFVALTCVIAVTEGDCRARLLSAAAVRREA